MKIGILALQGDYLLHKNVLDRLDVESLYIRTANELSNVVAFDTVRVSANFVSSPTLKVFANTTFFEVLNVLDNITPFSTFTVFEK